MTFTRNSVSLVCFLFSGALALAGDPKEVPLEFYPSSVSVGVGDQKISDQPAVYFCRFMSINGHKTFAEWKIADEIDAQACVVRMKGILSRAPGGRTVVLRRNLDWTHPDVLRVTDDTASIPDLASELSELRSRVEKLESEKSR